MYCSILYLHIINISFSHIEPSIIFSIYLSKRRQVAPGHLGTAFPPSVRRKKLTLAEGWAAWTQGTLPWSLVEGGRLSHCLRRVLYIHSRWLFGISEPSTVAPKNRVSQKESSFPTTDSSGVNSLLDLGGVVTLLQSL